MSSTLLFFQILFTMFIAEMGDKTQLLMIAMTSRYKLRDIIIGSGASILALNGIAVCLGALISQFIPTWLIKIIAALAFFYFAWTTLNKVDEGEEDTHKKESRFPVLTVFGTFFIAELGDKTQLTAITFAANEGAQHAVLIWLACSIGLFAADLIGMLVGHLIQSKMPEGFLDKLAFVIFAVFGVTTLKDGAALLAGGWTPWVIALCAAALFAVLCVCTWKKRHKDVCQS
ncbi:MAG: TMEM165/GDT1 family protein [Lachnospiraceae bacterium]|nr:TMEM165/GDT1 family protein [Lachnospiraceae bacterium]